MNQRSIFRKGAILALPAYLAMGGVLNNQLSRPINDFFSGRIYEEREEQVVSDRDSIKARIQYMQKYEPEKLDELRLELLKKSR